MAGHGRSCCRCWCVLMDAVALAFCAEVLRFAQDDRGWVGGAMVARRGGKRGQGCRRYRSRRGDRADMERSGLRPYIVSGQRLILPETKLLRGWVRNYSCCFPKGNGACSFWKP